jgi:polyhydroxybutyrate depolymerase
MSTKSISLLLTATALIGSACSTDGGDTGNGPTAGTTSTSGSGGSPSTPSAGSPATGGGGTSAGSTASAGTGGASGGSGSSTAGTGGTSGGGMSGGASGSGAGGGGGGSSSTATPSAGCDKAGRPAGGTVNVAGDHYFAFPESYDGKKPFPVLIGFHGCGSNNRGTNNTDTEFMRLSKGTAFETEYVRAVPVSADSGGCWNYNNDVTRVKKMYDDLVANYCVDTGRVFATGHSSGAQFTVQLFTTTHTADAQHLKLKGIAPVAASDYGAMTGPIPVMYIQGKMDKERGGGDGHETVARLRAANMCSDTSKPYTQVKGCQSGETMVDPGCVIYDGCKAPTIWCSHNDPAYSGTMHGVPCFGMTAMHDFFNTLP